MPVGLRNLSHVGYNYAIHTKIFRLNYSSAVASFPVSPFIDCKCSGCPATIKPASHSDYSDETQGKILCFVLRAARKMPLTATFAGSAAANSKIVRLQNQRGRFRARPARRRADQVPAGTGVPPAQERQPRRRDALCEEALRLRTESTSTHSLLGQLYEEKGNRAAAIRDTSAFWNSIPAASRTV